MEAVRATEALAYDGADRINRFDQIPIAAPVPVPQAAMTYEMDNRLATLNDQAFPSDLDGNMLAAPLGGGMIDGLGWDARNRLITVGNGTTYIYDAENRRVRSTTANGNTTYTWSRGSLDRLLVKANPDGSITRYVHGLGLLYEEHEPAGGGEAVARFYHFNWQGSTVAISDSAGQITARIAYSPYGTHQVTFGSADTPFLFNGQFGVMTEPHGLLHMMARFYSPTLRRFLSEDPVLFAGGDNFYAYAAGDPINLIDPFGLGPIPVGDADIDRELQQIFAEIDAANITNMDLFPEFISFMGTLDTIYAGRQKDFFVYEGSKYTELEGKSFSGAELNYIGVGAGFAARGWTPLGRDFGVRAWKLRMYGDPSPSANTFTAARLGYNAFKSR